MVSSMFVGILIFVDFIRPHAHTHTHTLKDMQFLITYCIDKSLSTNLRILKTAFVTKSTKFDALEYY